MAACIYIFSLAFIPLPAHLYSFSVNGNTCVYLVSVSVIVFITTIITLFSTCYLTSLALPLSSLHLPAPCCSDKQEYLYDVFALFSFLPHFLSQHSQHLTHSSSIYHELLIHTVVFLSLSFPYPFLAKVII